jgi:DNA replication initiation complex subunit (GINS family)
MDLTLLARQEKASKTLLELDSNFYAVARNEIAGMEQDCKLSSGTDQEMLEFNVLADRRAIVSIADIRISKIVKFAVSDAYRSVQAHAQEFMLPEERDLYQSIIDIITIIRSKSNLGRKERSE